MGLLLDIWQNINQIKSIGQKAKSQNTWQCGKSCSDELIRGLGCSGELLSMLRLLRRADWAEGWAEGESSLSKSGKLTNAMRCTKKRNLIHDTGIFRWLCYVLLKLHSTLLRFREPAILAPSSNYPMVHTKNYTSVWYNQWERNRKHKDTVL